jgi:hypothetical protein
VCYIVCGLPSQGCEWLARAKAAVATKKLVPSSFCPTSNTTSVQFIKEQTS